MVDVILGGGWWWLVLTETSWGVDFLKLSLILRIGARGDSHPHTHVGANEEVLFGSASLGKSPTSLRGESRPSSGPEVFPAMVPIRPPGSVREIDASRDLLFLRTIEGGFTCPSIWKETRRGVSSSIGPVDGGCSSRSALRQICARPPGFLAGYGPCVPFSERRPSIVASPPPFSSVFGKPFQWHAHHTSCRNQN